ncbi:S9 family peptidase [Ktedonospora formicarum]|uniref:Putative peptidase YuxL n=1 Tax=Ktedonospora formicarum TaxID=2778364 RepID=A0A8J3I104_9CHLR|nr:S9 family peptidase [Ktedonospora formicarum]GHO42924.1 putative peptidase YuxL [Ktedonospora formicarum]
MAEDTENTTPRPHFPFDNQGEQSHNQNRDTASPTQPETDIEQEQECLHTVGDITLPEKRITEASADEPATEETSVHEHAIDAQQHLNAPHTPPINNEAQQSTEASTPEQEPAVSATTINVPVKDIPTQAEEKKPLSALPSMRIEDLTEFQVAGEPQISPDGSLIAFSALTCDAEKNSTSSAIWLVESQGGRIQEPRQISSGEHLDFAPRWSPNGHSLAFVSTRSGSPQIYILPLQGGEARQVSSLPTGVSEYSWRPDGSMLLAHSPWKPADDQEQQEKEETSYAVTRLASHWDGTGYKQGRHEQLWLLTLDGQATRLTSEPVDLMQSCWSPDGNEIAFSANRRPDPDLSVSSALWVLTLATGQLRRLTPEEGLAQMPSWSPDGKTIAFLYTSDQTETGNISPWIVAASGKEEARPAAAGADELNCQMWIIDELRSEFLAAPQWYPDSQSFMVPTQAQGQVHLTRVNVTNNHIERLTSGNGRYLAPHLQRNGQAITMVRADWFTPGDIWSMDGAGGNLHKLTRVNDTLLRQRQLIRPKRITWKGGDGITDIEGWLYLPTLPQGKRAPLILAPHGGPTLAWGDSYSHEFQVLAGRGYAILAPNPRGSSGYGEQFSRAVLNDWGGGDFQDLMEGLGHVIATEPVDEQRLGISGISYGGYMTNWAITQTERFKAAVSRNGISDLAHAGILSDQTLWFNLSMETPELQHERSPLTYVDHIKTPLLLLHAENDLRCPISESVQLFVQLRKRKQTVQLVRYPQTSHLMDWPTVGTPQQRLDRIRRTISWFERFMKEA